MILEINKIEDIATLSEFMVRYRLDTIRLGNLEIKKSYHEVKPVTNPTITTITGKQKTPDELLDEELGITGMDSEIVRRHLGI